MSEPADHGALEFGERLVALLDGGRFTATYKFAVLLALVDECRAGVDETGRPPQVLSGTAVGRRVFALYWPQARPLGERQVSQSTIPNDIVSKIEQRKRDLGIAPGVPLAVARRRHETQIAELEREVITTVIRMPLAKLQRFGWGGQSIEQRFIYDFAWPDEVAASRVQADDFDDRLHLRPGVPSWLVSMAGLIRPLVQQRWASFTADRNADHLGEAQLEAFLFGAQRRNLAAVRQPLLEAQGGTCFYCQQTVGRRVEVDHFVPWAKHPDDGLDNLVAAHAACNNRKRDALAAVRPHLERWTQRLDPGSREGERFADTASQVAWPRWPSRTLGAARSLYLWLPPRTPLWQHKSTFVPSDPDAAAALLGSVGSTALAAEERSPYD